MKQRIISALCGIILLAIVLCFNKYLLMPTIVILTFMALWEFNNAFKNKYNSMMVLSYLFAASNFILIFNDMANLITNNLVIYMISLLLCIVFKNKKYNIDDICVTFFGYMYTVIFFSYALMLIGLDKVSLFYLILLLSISWGADTGGYFIGCLFGKHKLCEKLSPKKTIEGALGGVLFSIIFAICVVLIYNHFGITSFTVVLTPVGMTCFVILVAILSVLAQIGDLIASSVKRYAGIKDFSNIMPGHGGVLDRFDSTIFIAPVLYYAVELYRYIMLII